MRRNIGCHTYGNTGCTVHEQVWITAWKYDRFFLCLIKVWDKINCILVDICNHLHGNLGETCLSVSHRSRAIPIDGTEVSVSIDQWISCIPFLCQLYKCLVDRTVTMWMIFTHCITDDTGTFTMWLIRTIVQFHHGM